MKVKELIEHLQKFNPEQDVCYLICQPNNVVPDDINQRDYYWVVENVEEEVLEVSSYGDRVQQYPFADAGESSVVIL